MQPDSALASTPNQSEDGQLTMTGVQYDNRAFNRHLTDWRTESVEPGYPLQWTAPPPQLAPIDQLVNRFKKGEIEHLASVGSVDKGNDEDSSDDDYFT